MDIKMWGDGGAGSGGTYLSAVTWSMRWRSWLFTDNACTLVQETARLCLLGQARADKASTCRVARAAIADFLLMDGKSVTVDGFEYTARLTDYIADQAWQLKISGSFSSGNAWSSWAVGDCDLTRGSLTGCEVVSYIFYCN